MAIKRGWSAKNGLTGSEGNSRPHFTNLRVWTEAVELLREVKDLTTLFRGPDAQSAAKQLIEAAESISANIAEGYGKGFTPDNLRYLKIANSSADEVESRLHTSVAARRVTAEKTDIPLRRVRRIRSQLAGYYRYVESRIRKAS